jgi:acyl carrier protein
MQTTASRLAKIITTYLGVPPDQIVPSASFTEDFGADSLEMTELFMAIEQEFDLEIDDEEIDRILTVSDANSMLEKYTRAAKANVD